MGWQAQLSLSELESQLLLLKDKVEVLEKLSSKVQQAELEERVQELEVLLEQDLALEIERDQQTRFPKDGDSTEEDS